AFLVLAVAFAVTAWMAARARGRVRPGRCPAMDPGATHLGIGGGDRGLRTANRMTGGNTGGCVVVELPCEEGPAATVDRAGRVMGSDRASAARRPAPR